MTEESNKKSVIRHIERKKKYASDIHATGQSTIRRLLNSIIPK